MKLIHLYTRNTYNSPNMVYFQPQLPNFCKFYEISKHFILQKNNIKRFRENQYYK